MARATIEPRLLTKEQAAAYCGVSPPVFSDKCPVKPVALGESERLRRWDRNALDEWIDRLGGMVKTEGVDWIERVVKANGRIQGQRA